MTTLPQQTTIRQYVADGVTTDFSINFYVPISDIDSSPALAVYVTPEGQDPIPEDDIKVWSVDFIYTPLAVPIDGGTLTFLTGKVPANGSVITASRAVPAELDVDFADARTFSGETLDNVLLKLVTIEQQNQTYALNRNLSYRVNTFLPDAIIQANTQLPVLGENQIWQGNGDGVTAVTLEENPDVSTLRSELANDNPGTDGSNIVGYYDVLASAQTTVHNQLQLLTSNLRLFGTDSGSVNALALTIASNTATYIPNMVIAIIVANTNTSAATINFNGLGIVNIKTMSGASLSGGELIAGNLVTMIYDGTNFRLAFPISKTVIQTFTASGTYTPTPGMRTCIIECLGAGGGGGGAANSSGSGCGGGGGGGAYSRIASNAVSIGTSKTVTIGTEGGGGAAGANPGFTGTDTSVGTICLAKGGTGGSPNVGNQQAPGGAGGVSSVGTGDVKIDGGTGMAGGGSSFAVVTIASGAGAGTSISAGTTSSQASVNGANALTLGAGGSGGHSLGGGGAKAGGTGGRGLVIITEFVVI